MGQFYFGDNQKKWVSFKLALTYNALKEFGRLLKTKFIANYLSDVELRQRIQKQLNKVELGQKMSSAIFSERSQQFYVSSSIDFERTAAATNLIKNIIILWNYLYLSDYLLKLDSDEDKKLVIDELSKGCVIAYAHINLGGQFDFKIKDPKLITANKRKLLSLKLR